MNVAVTGVRGYVGTAIARAAGARGHAVVSLSRSPPDTPAWRPYELGMPVAPGLLDGIDVVVHCAYDLSATRAQDIERINIEGTRNLVAASESAGARFVLISSMSAYEGTAQLYGQAKLASERDVRRAGGNVARLGLVYGDGDGGMISSLTRLARLPVVPLIGGRSHQFMVQAGDMADAVTRLLERGDISGELAGLAHPQPVAFAALIRALGRRQGRAPRLLPIPWRPVYGAMRAAEAAGVSLPLRADSILGLVRPAPQVENVELWDRLGAHIRAPELGGLSDGSRGERSRGGRGGQPGRE